MVYEFGNLRSPEVDRVLRENPLVILPVGQTEEHGPHLPINTDCLIATAVASACATKLGAKMPVILMDLISYGYSGKIMTRWPGTMQIRMDTIRDYVYEVCASLADMGARKLAIFNNHGHHLALFELVARMIADEKGFGPTVLVPMNMASEELKSISKGGPGSSCHAGELETALLLHLKPELVELGKVKDNPVAAVGLPAAGVFWSTWERQPTKNGVYGTPRAASPETGKKAFEAIVKSAVGFLEHFCARE